MPTLDERIEAVRQGRGERDKPILLILDLAAERERLLSLALKAFTVVEWVAGQGYLLEAPYEDADDLLLEMVDALGVESSDEARAALASERRE